MSSSSTAPEESVMRELIAAFGEERARQIMSGPPAERKRPVPKRVGVKDRPLPALVPKPSGRPTLVELKNIAKAEGRRDQVVRVKIRRYHRAVNCTGCGSEIPSGVDVVRVHRMATAKDYCGPCGAVEARRG